MKNKDRFKVSERSILPFIVEFIKFSIAFVIIIAAALFVLHLLTLA